ncbi:MAG TPA: amino acid permease [Candidatus Aenigmarchaeota archaeon]|nr:MAG: amino acid transporter [Candidatus Aenigmarchaeota archaeon]HDD46010.1 amino acid permease [Candidatus Aenigmarchaeota archaeon]
MGKLKREISLWEATLTGVGIILGAGIYVLIGRAAGIAGNAVWLSFAIAALIAAFTGLSYAELSSLIPKAGAEYEYVKHAFGKRLAFILGWLLIIAGIVSASTVALGFAGYFGKLFNIPLLPSAVALILLLSIPLFYGVKESVRLGVAMTLIEAFGLFFIISIGVPNFGSVNYLDMPNMFAIFQASALIFFAYIGFGQIVRLAEETKDARSVIPHAVILSVVITTIIYILVALSAVSIIDWHALSASPSPLADVAAKVLGNNAFVLLSFIALFSTTNTVLFIMLSTSRLIYGMAEKTGSIFAYVHPKRKTPWVAIACVTVLALAFLFVGGIEKIAGITNFMFFINYILINLTVIKLRYSMANEHREFKIPVNIGKFPLLAFLGMLTSFIMIASLNAEIVAWGIALVGIGFVVHEILVRKGFEV